MKGVSTIVVVILLLLISIAIVGLAFGFFGRVIGTSTAEGQKSVTTFVGQAQQTVSIELATGSSVYLRNTGTTSIAAGTLAVYKASALWANMASCPGSAVAPGVAFTCTASPATPCTAGDTIRVTTVSGVADSNTCS